MFKEIRKQNRPIEVTTFYRAALITSIGDPNVTGAQPHIYGGSSGSYGQLLLRSPSHPSGSYPAGRYTKPMETKASYRHQSAGTTIPLTMTPRVYLLQVCTRSTDHCAGLPFRKADVAIAEVKLSAENDEVQMNERAHQAQGSVVECAIRFLEESVRGHDGRPTADENDL